MTQDWHTADGQKVDLYTICHQHLSNIFYYTHFILAEKYDDDTRGIVQGAMDKRFNGKALPYNPKFKWEMDYLQRRGWLRKNGSIIINHVRLR